MSSAGLFFIQQLSGINAVVFFSNAIFRQVRLGFGKSELLLRCHRVFVSLFPRMRSVGVSLPPRLAFACSPDSMFSFHNSAIQAGISSDTLASATVGAVNVLGTFVASLARTPARSFSTHTPPTSFLRVYRNALSPSPIIGPRQVRPQAHALRVFLRDVSRDGRALRGVAPGAGGARTGMGVGRGRQQR